MALTIGKKLGINTILFSLTAIVPFIILSSMAISTARDSFIYDKFEQLISLRGIKKAQIEKFFDERKGDMGVLVETVGTLRKEAFDKLTAVREVKRQAVERYFQTINDQIITFSEDGMVVNAMRQFSKTFKNFRNENNVTYEQLKEMRSKLFTYYKGEFSSEYRNQNNGRLPNAEQYFSQLDDDTVAMQYHYIRANRHPLGSKHLLDRSDDASRYSELHARVHPIIRNFLEKFGYYDIFLVDSETGDIVYSVFKELDYSTSLIDGPYAQTNFGEAFRRANAASNKDAVILVDYAKYAPSYEAPASFIASPIYDGRKKIGVALFQMPIDRLNAIMGERAGLGKTGETYLVGSDKLMRSDSHLDPEHHNVVASFKHPEKGRVETTAADAALGGRSGAEVINDYNGNPVLSAYTPVKIDDITWGMLVEIDEKEVISESVAAETLLRRIWLIGIVSMIIAAAVILMGVLIAGNMSRTFRRITVSLNEGSDQVSSASGQVSSASQSLTEGASEQAASIEETSASLEEMSSMTRQNAQNAHQADKLMTETNQVVGQANQTMTGLDQSMNEIARASEETSKIIKTIDEIAFQTNLLALNAAVDAARAGEAGAGFAVVADEVRNLSLRAAEAAKNTTGLIEETVKTVNSGSEYVSRTSEAFGNVAESARKVGGLVGEIASASNEQAQGIGQVNTAVTEMDGVIQKNAASAEESAAAAEQLNAQAEQMKSIVSELTALVGGSRNGGNDHRTVRAWSQIKKIKT